MSYVLATTDKVIRWYVFDPVKCTSFSIIDKLDTSLVPKAHDKGTAKSWAKALGLTTWNYVRLK